MMGLACWVYERVYIGLNPITSSTSLIVCPCKYVIYCGLSKLIHLILLLLLLLLLLHLFCLRGKIIT